MTYEKRICQRSGDSNIKWIQVSTPSFLLMGWRMEDCERLRREYQIAILEHQNHMIDSALFLANRNRSIKVTYGDVSKSLWRCVNVGGRSGRGHGSEGDGDRYIRSAYDGTP